MLALYLCTFCDALEEHFRTEGFPLAEKKIAVLIPLMNYTLLHVALSSRPVLSEMMLSL